MRILYLSQRVPYPPNRGDKIATWRMVDWLRQRHEVHCVAFAHNEGDLEAAAALEAMGIPITAIPLDMGRAKLRSLPLFLTKRPLTLGVYGSRALQEAVDRLAPTADLAIAYSSSMGAYLLPHPALRRIQYVGELDSDKWAQYAGFTPWPMSWVYAREARTLFAFEKELCAAVDLSVFCTPLEERIFQERIPGLPSAVQRNGVDLEHFRPRPAEREPGHLVFTGVMDYFPNVDGCLWFVDEVLPRVRERVPAARLSIVGSSPSKAVRALDGRPGVEVTGFVPETRDWLARAAVAVAPLRIARGIQNKVLEAMAMGLPTVGTSKATQGVGGQAARDYLVADDVATQTEAVVRLLQDDAEAAALGARARAFVEEHYAWEHVLTNLDELIDQVVAAPPPARQR